MKNYFELLGLRSPYLRYKDCANLIEKTDGWTGNHVFFTEIITKYMPNSIIEVGSYMGQSTITMGKQIKTLNLDSSIICIDTWLGSPEHWRSDMCNRLHLYDFFENGISKMYDQFIINIVLNKLDNIVFPIPNTSKNAFDILKWKNITADLIYIDGSHEELDVYNDIVNYSQLLNSGGKLIGDDYTSWESVKLGVNSAASRLKMKLTIHHNYFWELSFI